jgi:hypothetical protein
MRILASGFVGIGLTAPGTKLDISGSLRNSLATTHSLLAGSGNVAVMADNTGTLYTSAATTMPSGILGSTLYNNGTIWIASTTPLFNNGTNVGIGTTAPGTYKLKVAGNVAITGTLETQTGSDFAEEFKTDAALEPGTVVVLGDDGYKSAKPSEQAYDTKVIGVVSDNPSIIAGRSGDKNGHQAIVAMVGVVKVKVSALNGAIRKGDLLTTSSLRGYAMKAGAAKPGTIIGKALEDLAAARGEIRALVNLQ